MLIAYGLVLFQQVLEVKARVPLRNVNEAAVWAPHQLDRAVLDASGHAPMSSFAKMTLLQQFLHSDLLSLLQNVVSNKAVAEA